MKTIKIGRRLIGPISTGLGIALLAQLALSEPTPPYVVTLTLLAACCLILMPLLLPRRSHYLTPAGVDKSYKESFEEVAIGLVHVDLDGTFIRVNRSVCDFLGYSERELLQTTFQELSLPEELPASVAFIKATLSGEIEHSFSLVKRYRHKQGHLVWAKLTTTLIRDAQGDPHYFLSSILDVAELKQAEARLDESLLKLKNAYLELEQASRRDGLTGALNITAFKECVQSAYQHFARYGTPATLVFIDLDRFKEINDTHGHLLGDQVLIEVVKQLQHAVRKTDSVGRYGGDEFAVLLTNSDAKQAEEYCRRLGTTILLQREERPAIEVGISIGVYQLTGEIEGVDQWLELADHQMYAHKKQETAE